jgi:uncharacterized protein (TIGR02246 family)
MRISTIAAIAGLAISPATAPAADQNMDARQAAESLVQSFMTAYNSHNLKGVSALFTPDAVLLGIDGKVSRGRDEIEHAYDGLLKNPNAHITIVIKNATPASDNVVVADDEIHISGIANQEINGRAVITLTKTPDG